VVLQLSNATNKHFKHYLLIGSNKPECDFCLDNPDKLCKECACSKCGGKDRPNLQIICDECNGAWHIGCLTPPLTEIPEEDEW